MINPKDFEGDPEEFDKMRLDENDPEAMRYYQSSIQKLKREIGCSQKWDAKTNKWINTENEV